MSKIEQGNNIFPEDKPVEEAVNPFDEPVELQEDTQSGSATEQKALTLPNFYIRKSRLVLPSAKELIVAARVDYGKDIEIPTPPDDLFETLENLAKKNVRGLEVYYQPGVHLGRNNNFWKAKDRVKPMYDNGWLI